MRIVTHNAKFHTDDVFSVAALLILYPEAEVVRTREEDLIKLADIVVDVGQVYDAKSNRFDHHQVGGAGQRANGIQYASFGLVWQKFGEEVSGSPEVAEKIDRTMAQLVDAADNGQDVISSTIPELFPFTINGIVDQYRPTWKEVENWDERFMEAVHWAQAVIKREIKIAADVLEGAKVIEQLYRVSAGKKIFVFGGKSKLWKITEFFQFGNLAAICAVFFDNISSGIIQLTCFASIVKKRKIRRFKKSFIV